MGPVPLALRQLLEAELYRSLQTEAMVRNDSVIGEQPFRHFTVEQGQVGERLQGDGGIAAGSELAAKAMAKRLVGSIQVNR